uniref:Uncharacterized protein n=1 Tax=Hyaloperonospora arabidopsidis (strain Emoy2) TaxID=559515 RepID=M4BG59_HYAAE
MHRGFDDGRRLNSDASGCTTSISSQSDCDSNSDSDCTFAIDVRSWDTTPTSVVLHAQCLVTPSEVINRLPRRAKDARPTLLRSQNSLADRKNTVGVSRALRPY